MPDPTWRRGLFRLAGSILAAALYGAWLAWLTPLDPYHRLWGAVGVVLGLFICAQPAANAIDLLFFQRLDRWSPAARRGLWLWLAVNALTLFAGWLLISVSITLLIER